MAVEETLQVGGEVSHRLDRLGPGVFEVPGLLRVPPLRRWAARKASQAYHHGFIQGLAQDPRATVLAVVEEAGSCTGATTARTSSASNHSADRNDNRQHRS